MKLPQLLLSVVLLLSACSKDKNDKIPERGLTARFNESDYTFDQNRAIYQTNQVYHQLYITGYIPGYTNGQYGEITIVVNADKEITPGTYRYDPARDIIDAHVDLVDSYETKRQGLAWSSLFFTSTDPLTVTITSLRDSTLQGHFAGEVRLRSADPSGKKISGGFNIPYTRMR